MKLNKHIHIKIGVDEKVSRYGYSVFWFRMLWLKRYPPRGEMLKFGRDYIGINYYSNSWKNK